MEEAIPKKKGTGLAGSTLKWIAIISMMIDHMAAILLMPQIEIIKGIPKQSKLLYIYIICRQIGRIAFPIFCFLLVEGFFHTHNRKNYAIRLFLFALLSEIPFDLAFSNQIIYSDYQNVFFTLLIGFMMMAGLQEFKDKIVPQIKTHQSIIALSVQLLIFAAAVAAAVFMQTDYSYWGIIAIFGMYILRYNKRYLCFCEAIYFLSFEASAAFAFIPIWFYNGKRGWNIKYFFYIFYPAHLLIFYLLGRYFL